MKIILCGGHTATGLAVLDELKLKKNCQVVWFGRRKNSIREEKDSFEYKEVTKRKIKFVNIPTGRFNRELNLKFLHEIALFIRGVFIAIKHIYLEKPLLVISFGGYVGMTVAIACIITKTQYIIHEQTTIPGLTNRITGIFCKRVYIGFKEAEKYFNIKKTLIIGNPIRRGIIQAKSLKKKYKNKPKPLLLIIGGTTGSHSINTLILPIINKLTAHFTVVHQCGESPMYRDYEKLQKISSKSYKVITHLSTQEMVNMYSKADMVISRAGANTVTELMYLAIPSILIPLPWSAFGEQTNNAIMMKKIGISEIFYQPRKLEEINRIISENLYQLIMKMKANIKNYRVELDSTLHATAAKKLVHEISKFV